MQLSLQALPAEQTLQQAAKADEAQAGEAQVMLAGPIADNARTRPVHLSLSVLRSPAAARLSFTASSVQPPCFQAPLAAPFGAPEPRPPCIRQTRCPFTAGDMQESFCRV